LVLTNKVYRVTIWELSADDYDNCDIGNLLTREEPTNATTEGCERSASKAIADAKAANDAKVLSAKNKLKALGLTEAEVTALVG
jgi:hypothetical protein